MEHEFWLTRWREGKTAFHQAEGHPMLRKYMEALGTGEGQRVLVPLCGKAADLRVLSERGFLVTGIELAAQATEAFFAEQGWEPVVTEGGAWGEARRMESHGVAILTGDFFSFERSGVGEFAAVYDRAALVALPPEMRGRYAQHLLSLLAPGGVMLLITFTYDQALAAGPPFSVPADEVRALYGNACEITLLGESVEEVGSATLRAQGVSQLTEHAWLLKRRPEVTG